MRAQSVTGPAFGKGGFTAESAEFAESCEKPLRARRSLR